MSEQRIESLTPPPPWSSRISSCITMTRLVADRQHLLTNLSRLKDDKQTDEEIEMGQTRWVDSQAGRYTDTLTDSFRSFNRQAGRQPWRTQAVMTSMTMIWVTEQQTPPHAVSTSPSYSELFSPQTQSHYHRSTVLRAAGQDVVVMGAPVYIKDRSGVAVDQRIVLIHTTCLQHRTAVTHKVELM